MHHALHSFSCLISWALALLVSVSALAGDVSFDLSPLQGWVGTPAVLKVTVRNGTMISDPLLP